MRRLAILGASGHGKVVAEAAECSGWDAIAFFDDRWPSMQANRHWPVIGGTSELVDSITHYDGVVIAIGSNATRLDKFRQLASSGARLVSIVHPSAVVSTSAVLGIGSVVFAGAVINADARIGLAAIVNTGATVDHDCILGDAIHISPGVHLAGGVEIGDRSWIGIGSCVRQLVQIGADVIVGAGATVVRNVGDGLTVAGVPAAPL
jgi:sugar O-acyltransferase (sialic acid O-acetyltransferase NeuD family)